MSENTERDVPETGPVEPGQTWQADLFRPEDAREVARLFHTVYGAGYPVRTFVEPARLIAENAAGKTISTVARTSRGDIVGHLALFRSAPYDRIYESGAGLVLPAYRGAAMMKALFDRQVLDADRFGVEMIYGETVCNHVYMQKLCISEGWITCGVEIDLMPAEAYVAEQSASGRVSSLLDFRFDKPRPHKVHLPGCYAEMLQYIYEGVQEERELTVSSPEVDLPAGIPTRIESEVFDFAQVVRLAVHEAGRDLASALGAAEKAAAEQGVEIFQVWGKLSWPWAGRVMEQLRSRGYFTGGVLPRWFNDDGFLMQKTLRRPNWEGIQLQSERARRILDFIRADWERTQGV